MTLDIKKISFNYTQNNTSITAPKSDNREVISIFNLQNTQNVEKTQNTNKAKNVNEADKYKKAEETLDQILSKLGNNKSLTNTKNIVDQLLNTNEHSGITLIANNLNDKIEILGEQKIKIIGTALEAISKGGSPEEIEATLNDLKAQAENLVEQMKNLENKAKQTQQLNQSVFQFKAKGGNPESINWQQIAQDMTQGIGNTDTKGNQDNNANSDSINNSQQDFDKKFEELLKTLNGGQAQKSQTNEYITQDMSNQTNTNPFTTQNPEDQEQKKRKFGFLGLNNV